MSEVDVVELVVTHLNTLTLPSGVRAASRYRDTEAPLAVIARFGGNPIQGDPTNLDLPLIQIDAYAATEQAAFAASADVRAALKAMRNTTHALGVVGRVTLFGTRNLWSSDLAPAKPRVISEARVPVHPTRST